MMVKPTVKELLTKVDNRFELVVVTAKRARQIANGAQKLTDVDEEVPVTIAANEIVTGTSSSTSVRSASYYCCK